MPAGSSWDVILPLLVALGPLPTSDLTEVCSLGRGTHWQLAVPPGSLGLSCFLRACSLPGVFSASSLWNFSFSFFFGQLRSLQDFSSRTGD